MLQGRRESEIEGFFYAHSGPTNVKLTKLKYKEIEKVATLNAKTILILRVALRLVPQNPHCNSFLSTKLLFSGKFRQKTLLLRLNFIYLKDFLPKDCVDALNKKMV
jgi:hypothetical protein